MRVYVLILACSAVCKVNKIVAFFKVMSIRAFGVKYLGTSVANACIDACIHKHLLANYSTWLLVITEFYKCTG